MTIAVIYSLFKFRKRKDQYGDGDGIALEGNLTLEIVWTIIPSIIVLIIGLYSYNIYDRMGGMKELNHSHEMMTSNTEKIWAGISQASNNERTQAAGDQREPREEGVAALGGDQRGQPRPQHAGHRLQEAGRRAKRARCRDC